MKIRGPLVTLGAVAAAGLGIWLANVSQQPDSATPPTPVAESVAAAPTKPPEQQPPPKAQFPRTADYVGKIPIKTGTITLDIAVDGGNAIAYACDGNSIEVWLRGRAVDGAVSLANKDATSRLEGRLQGSSVTGTLWIDQKSWDFTANPIQPPAGLYVYQDDGVRNSWIVDENQAVTGVQRQADGSTSPAPRLAADAVRVEGDSNVF